MDDKVEEDVGNQNVNNIKFLHRDKIWTKFFCTFDLPSVEFLKSRGNTNIFVSFPIILALWNLFRPHRILQQIVTKTNCYAMLDLDAIGSTMKGPHWIPLTIPSLKAFFTITMYMGLKKQPNIKMHWKKFNLFHCLIISNIMT